MSGFVVNHDRLDFSWLLATDSLLYVHKFGHGAGVHHPALFVASVTTLGAS